MTPNIDLDGLLRRLHLPTVQRLHAELAVRAEKEEMSYRDYLALLIGEEVAHRVQTRIARAVRRARFPFLKTIEEFDWTFQTSIQQRLLGSYLGPELVTEGRGLIFHGPTGTGKTSLSIAIAYRAIQNGFDALFTSANELIADLSAASAEKRLAEALIPYTHTPVLVIDEVGYLVHPPDAANVLFQVVNDRYLKHRPMIFTTNKSTDVWGRVLHDADLADAILDRVLERGRVIDLTGPSYRTRHLASASPAQRGTPATTSSPPPSPTGGRGGRPAPRPKDTVPARGVTERTEQAAASEGSDGAPLAPPADQDRGEAVRIVGKQRSEYLEPADGHARLLNAVPERTTLRGEGSQRGEAGMRTDRGIGSHRRG